MFFIFNKDKILSYLVSLSTVAVLFVFAFTITKTPNTKIDVSTNAYVNETIVNYAKNWFLKNKIKFNFLCRQNWKNVV